MRFRQQSRFTALQAGLLALLVAALITYLEFAGLPFGGGGFELKATFENAPVLDQSSRHPCG